MQPCEGRGAILNITVVRTLTLTAGLDLPLALSQVRVSRSSEENPLETVLSPHAPTTNATECRHEPLRRQTVVKHSGVFWRREATKRSSRVAFSPTDSSLPHGLRSFDGCAHRCVECEDTDTYSRVASITH